MKKTYGQIKKCLEEAHRFFDYADLGGPRITTQIVKRSRWLGIPFDRDTKPKLHCNKL